jgi:hypothetical protein
VLNGVRSLHECSRSRQLSGDDHISRRKLDPPRHNVNALTHVNRLTATRLRLVRCICFSQLDTVSAMKTWKAALISSVALALGVGVSAGAQPARANRPDTLHVGSVRLPGVYMRDDSSEFIVVVPDSTALDGQRLVGRLSKRQRVIDRGTPMLFRFNHFSGRTSEVTDSVVTTGADLVPISETSSASNRRGSAQLWSGCYLAGPAGLSRHGVRPWERVGRAR